ncbi:ANR family transcriptional regulator [Vibrio sp. LaRot3]|uniref:ANR family transcriptional regulator n=1 Tax=Vibrio sp. LaRot3 TaxID=2998829 RepID=UPI0022CE274D|nr:ANR family transcriptional regulator [Vibrio sp. LaRot3]MDA0148828.1 ANR family transcriptional regulator [Vibrio sp. LaRot3]
MFSSTPAKSEYPEHAELAAQLERDGMYSNAAFTWMAAAHHARSPENRHWAESRADFCNSWARRYQRSKAA